MKLAILLSLLFAMPAFADGYYYRGRFQHLNASTHAECDHLFDKGDYETSIHFLQNNPYVTVLHFETESDGVAPFDGASFTGRYGNGEAIYEKTLAPATNRKHYYYLEGLQDQNVIALDVGIRVYDTSTNTDVCVRTAEFFASKTN